MDPVAVDRIAFSVASGDGIADHGIEFFLLTFEGTCRKVQFGEGDRFHQSVIGKRRHQCIVLITYLDGVSVKLLLYQRPQHFPLAGQDLDRPVIRKDI